MQKVKNTIPVYDICSLSGHDHINHELIAEPFAEYLKVHPNLHHPHRHSFYHMVLFTRGAGYHTIDFQRFDVLPGQVYFMIPGQVHSWAFDGPVDGYIINCSPDLFRGFLVNEQYPEQYPFFGGVAADSVYQLAGQAYRDAEGLFARIIAEVHSRDAWSPDAIRAALIALFVTVARSNPQQQVHAPQQNQLVLQNFRKLVDTYYAEKRLPKDYAAMLYITPNHLNALCKDLLGRPAGEVIRDRILLEAKRLLVNAGLSIAEIGSGLSFADSSHFTKFFKKYTNTTPEEFRKASFGNR